VGFLHFGVPSSYLGFGNFADNGKKAPVWKSTKFDAGLYDITTFSETDTVSQCIATWQQLKMIIKNIPDFVFDGLRKIKI